MVISAIILITIAIMAMVYLRRLKHLRSTRETGMPAGLQVNDANGNTVLDVTDRITRILTTDSIPYADTFTRTYVFDEFLNHSPFVICSSFNVYTSVVGSQDVYITGYPTPFDRVVWYQVTWSLQGNKLIITGNKSNFTQTGSFGTLTINSARLSKPPFELIIGVY